MSRRRCLGALAASAIVGLPLSARAAATGLPSPPTGTNPSALAKDEKFWSTIATNYDRTKGIVNLEHGYWGKMAHPVQDAYIAATRNATESVHNLIRQYRGLTPDAAILYADIDYPHFKTAMHWLHEARGARPVELTIPARATQGQLFELYRDAFDENPDLKLMLIMHVSNQHGLKVPVARIATEARKRGIDVICDAAQSWGLLDYQLPSLQVDWAGFNLHKWIGTPVGVGALYMRRGSLHKVAPYPGESDRRCEQGGPTAIPAQAMDR